jgi:hypothetical protein
MSLGFRLKHQKGLKLLSLFEIIIIAPIRGIIFDFKNRNSDYAPNACTDCHYLFFGWYLYKCKHHDWYMRDSI